MEFSIPILPPEFIETNLQLTDKKFQIPTNPSKEFRSARRDIIRDAYKLLLSRLNGKNYINNDFLGKDIHIIWLEGKFPKSLEQRHKELANHIRCAQTA